MILSMETLTEQDKEIIKNEIEEKYGLYHNIEFTTREEIEKINNFKLKSLSVIHFKERLVKLQKEIDGYITIYVSVD